MEVMHPTEDHLQAACVAWFNKTYPHLRGCLFAVPNGGLRDKVTQARLINSGLMPGVPDLILIVGGVACGIEMKLPKGVQSPMQKKIQDIWGKVGNQYFIARSEEEFCEVVKNFLKNI